MLKHLKKFFNEVDKEVNMTAPEQLTDTSAINEQLAALTVSMAELKASSEASMTELAKVVEDVKAERDAALALVATLEAAKADAETSAKAAQLLSRKEKLEAAIGTVKAANVLASLEGLDEATFATVVGAMAATFDAEATTPRFNETGATVDAGAGQVVVESAEMKIIKDKQAKAAKAAQI